MNSPSEKNSQKRRAVNLTIRATLLEEAKSLNLNTSQAAEQGVEAAVRKAREEAWLRENKAAIQAYNERVERDGLLLKPSWKRR